jgi:RNA methyltransferase, TrmH family
MISKNILKHIISLQQKKIREAEMEFIAEGKNNVEEGLKSSYRCNYLLYTEEFISSHPQFINWAEEKNVRHAPASETDFNKASGSVNPQGILAVFEIPDRIDPDFKIDEPIIYLDDISDPGNVGTIIRTCDWFGFKSIILSKSCADIYNPKTVRSSAGSLFHLNLYAGYDLSPKIKLNGFKILAADMKGENIYSYKFDQKIVLVFSNEAHGLSDAVKNYADTIITIPKSGEAESLNVASAAAVILSHIRNIS